MRNKNMSEDKITVKIGKDKTEFLKDGVPFGRYSTNNIDFQIEVNIEGGTKWYRLNEFCLEDLIPVEDGGKA